MYYFCHEKRLCLVIELLVALQKGKLGDLTIMITNKAIVLLRRMEIAVSAGALKVAAEVQKCLHDEITCTNANRGN
jgi:hypothetical protein